MLHLPIPRVCHLIWLTIQTRHLAIEYVPCPSLLSQGENGHLFVLKHTVPDAIEFRDI